MAARTQHLDLSDDSLWSHWSARIHASTRQDAERALASPTLDLGHLAALLSPAAAPLLEDLAARARAVTLRRFGRTVVLYVPLYLSSACTNRCTYCGFSQDRGGTRRTLRLEEVAIEARRLRELGFEHVLLLTGEDLREAPLGYLRDAVALCRGLFSSVGVEVYPLDEPGYRTLAEAGCDSLTLYQETYHAPTYRSVHPAGPKSRRRHRLEAPARAASAGLRSVGIGALLGLADWRVEGMFLAAHGSMLRQRFWRTRLSIGFPRLRTAPGAGLPLHGLDEAELTQLICALRLFFADADLVLSTRERGAYRDGMVGLGITRMSAGSRTQPGGYALVDESLAQFEVTDGRLPADVAAMIEARGFEPVWKDFDRSFGP